VDKSLDKSALKPAKQKALNSGFISAQISESFFRRRIINILQKNAKKFTSKFNCIMKAIPIRF
jgi:hypothetical protein